MSWALVTGAAKRLGRAVSLELARGGWDIAVHYNGSAHDAEDTANALRTLGVKAVTFQADVSDLNALAPLVTAANKLGDLRALVNCAAIFEHDVIETLSPQAFDKQMHVNALAPSLLARAFASQLPPDARGAIVNFLDFKLASPYPDHFSYTLSKYALMGATELLSRALAPRIRVNAVAPGYVLPAPDQPQADYERLHAQTPLNYGVTAEDVASAVRYLIEAPAITGQTIYVDAGLRHRSHDRDMSFQ